MRDLKRAHPKLPILMFTQEHSEALAVWAFRARVWNYCVKPVPTAELEETLQALAKIAGVSSAPRAAHLPVASIPRELPEEPVAPVFTQLQPALRFVEEHFAERIQAEQVALLCGFTRFTFSRAFHSAIGMTFRDYVLRYRIKKACELLLDHARPVTDIAFSVGFNDASHFARIFRRCVGVLPSEYQNGERSSGSSLAALTESTDTLAGDGDFAEEAATGTWAVRARPR
jgi:AraC-like DNA-binding protein